MTKFSHLLTYGLALTALLLPFGKTYAFPSAKEITGYYKFSSTFTAAENFTSTLESSFTFDIQNNSGTFTINNFLFTSTNSYPNTNTYQATYDETTGQLSFTKYYYGNSITGNYAISAGEWLGFKDTPMVWQFSEDGKSITIPDFSFIKFSGSTILNTYGYYSECSAVATTSGGNGGGNGGGGGNRPSTDGPLDGVWTITSSDPYFADGGTQNSKYNVTSQGNVLTFTAVAEYEGTSTIGDIFKGTLNEAGDAVTFSPMTLNNSFYPQYQAPFTNGSTSKNSSVNNLNTESFTAYYDSTSGILSFPEGVGLRFTNVDAQTLEPVIDWQAALNLISATRDGDFPPTVSITANNYQVGANSITAVYNFSLTRLESPETLVWLPNVTQIITQAEDENDDQVGDDLHVTLDNCTLTMDFKANTATILIPDLKAGVNEFLISISAYNNEEDLIPIVTSNARALSLPVGASVSIRAPKVEVTETSITVTANYASSTLPEGAYFKMKFTTTESLLDEEAEEDSTYVDAIVANGKVTATLDGLTANTRYDYTVALVIFNAIDEELAVSNNLTITATTNEVPGAGVDSLENESSPARYFNLNGLEITKPTKGEVYIKVENGKATKQIIH